MPRLNAALAKLEAEGAPDGDQEGLEFGWTNVLLAGRLRGDPLWYGVL
jgi:hypothetical protein